MNKDLELRRKYRREWLAKRRTEFFNGKCCMKCGSTVLLELHHVDPTKKITHNIWDRNKSFQSKELKKCTVLCKRCHKKVTEARHGTISRYREHRCRCAACKTVWNERTKFWKLKHKTGCKS